MKLQQRGHTAFLYQACLKVALLGALLCSAACQRPEDSLPEETRRMEQWRQTRLAALTGETGWLTLVGLFWLKEGSNSFGRSTTNSLALNHPALADRAGVFELHAGKVSFTAMPGAHISHDGKPVSALDLLSDAAQRPTILTSGSLRFTVIERAGQVGVRVRDIAHPARHTFNGLDYFPISMDWRIQARFEAYVPSKHIAIVNILGMTEPMESPGAFVFDKAGKSWRLDALRESPNDSELFVMFNDASNGRDTYGAGRFMYVPRPASGAAWLDFNQAFNPPCAFTEFATCPLPPRQNRLSLNVSAGEKKYVAH